MTLLQDGDEGDEDGCEPPAAASSVPGDAQQAVAAAAQAPPRRGDRPVRVSDMRFGKRRGWQYMKRAACICQQNTVFRASKRSALWFLPRCGKYAY